jgi:hypothetical protein
VRWIWVRQRNCKASFFCAVRSFVCRGRRLVREPVFVGDIREREELLSASMALDSAAGIRQLFLRYREAGVGFFRPLKREPRDARTFIVRDPDGNLLLFAGPAT